MSNRKIFFDNSLYAEAFLHHLLDHPRDAEWIPDGAVIMFSPEDRDPGLSAEKRLVVKAPEGYTGRPVIPVGVEEVEGQRERYRFVFPWTRSGEFEAWVRFNDAPLIQEVLSATIGTKEDKPTWYIVDRQLPIIPSLDQVPSTIGADAR